MAQEARENIATFPNWGSAGKVKGYGNVRKGKEIEGKAAVMICRKKNKHRRELKE